MQAKLTFAPAGLIPEFNALGNHPTDMIEYIQTRVKNAFIRLNLEEMYPEAERVFCDIAEYLSTCPLSFTGQYLANEVTRKIMPLLFKTIIKPQNCHFIGKEHYDHALDLMKQGHNILVIQNHSSALDVLVAETVTQGIYGPDLPISYIASQVFEYARVTAIVTSGVNKFPVFPPKHIKKMRSNGKGSVAAEMQRQNLITFRSLARYANTGGKMIFIYPQRFRTSTITEPEPEGMQIPLLLQKASERELFVLPTYVYGAESILPNNYNVNELDLFFERLEVGQGDMYCGKLYSFEKLLKTAKNFNPENLTENILNEEGVLDQKRTLFAGIATIMLGSVANLAPSPHLAGGYLQPYIQGFLQQL